MDKELLETVASTVTRADWLIDRLQRQRKKVSKAQAECEKLQGDNEELQRDLKTKEEEIQKLEEAADDGESAELTRIFQLELENASLSQDNEELKLELEALQRDKQTEVDKLEETLKQATASEATAREDHEQFAEFYSVLSEKSLAMEARVKKLEKDKASYVSQQIKKALARQEKLSKKLSEKQLALDQANEKLESLAQAVEASAEKNKEDLLLQTKEELPAWRNLLNQLKAALSLSSSAEGEKIEQDEESETVSNAQEVMPEAP